MTTTLEPATGVVQKLIDSCRQTHEGFRSAAEAVDNTELKRLFSIYAQQRNRFAEELRQQLRIYGEASDGADVQWEELGTHEILRRCFDAEKRALDTYSEALSCDGMPTKAHFLISAQYSLLQRAHARVRGIFADNEA